MPTLVVLDLCLAKLDALGNGVSSVAHGRGFGGSVGRFLGRALFVADVFFAIDILSAIVLTIMCGVRRALLMCPLIFFRKTIHFAPTQKGGRICNPFPTFHPLHVESSRGLAGALLAHLCQEVDLMFDDPIFADCLLQHIDNHMRYLSLITFSCSRSSWRATSALVTAYEIASVGSWLLGPPIVGSMVIMNCDDEMVVGFMMYCARYEVAVGMACRKMEKDSYFNHLAGWLLSNGKGVTV